MNRWFVIAIIALLGAMIASLASAQPAVRSLDRRFDELRTTLADDPTAGLRGSQALENDARAQLGPQAELVAASQWLQAEAYIRLDDMALARQRIASALAILSKVTSKSPVVGDLLRSRGYIATEAGDFAQALSDYQYAFNIYRASNDNRGQSLSLIAIASLYRQGADYIAALRYFGQAIDVYSADTALLISLYNNRGNVLAEMKQYDRARTEFDRALSLVRETGDRTSEATIWKNLATAQVGLKNFDAAKRSLARSSEAGGQVASKSALNSIVLLQARVAAEQQDTKTAVRLVDQVFSGVDLGKTSIAERSNHLNAFLVYKSAGDAAQALRHLEALARLDEQAAQITTSTKTALMSARFDFQNQELRIARLKQEELRRNVEIERSQARFQRILTAGITGTAIVILGLLTVGILTLRRSRNRVRDANVELEITNDALGRALKARTEFLATTSHEIRTPLNGILGMTQVMLADPQLAPVTRDRLGIVHGAGVTMRSLVDDILDVAKMETGNLTIEQVSTDLSTALNDVARMWQAQAEDRGIRFILDTASAPQWIETDPARLRQIIFNLLSNALKFTQAGEVGLRVTVCDDRLRIAVWDTGIGIPADKIDTVFESFNQADSSTTRQYGGTGLGLTICRNLAQALGGDISVASEPGEGSTFVVDLPFVEASEPDRDTAVCDDPAQCDLIVLERNPIARSMLRTLFERKVAAVHFARDLDDLIGRIRGGDVARVLIEEATLRTLSDDPVCTLQKIAAAMDEVGARGAVLVAADDAELRQAARVGTALTFVAKPVSGAQLAAALLRQKDEGAVGRSALVSRAA